MIGIGARVAQDVGAHRRKYSADNLKIEDELWKRAFWCAPVSVRFYLSHNSFIGFCFAWIAWRVRRAGARVLFKTKSRQI